MVDDQLKSELAKLRNLGIEPIPKLNFSTTHDHWMGPYSRMVSTPKYYEVCADLISECCDIFDGPRLFHLGFDEETYGHQRYQQYIVIRQFELWWKDLMFLVEQVEKKGARGVDMVGLHLAPRGGVPREDAKVRFSRATGTTARACTPEDEPSKLYVKAYDTLEANGYDQMPTGSNHSSPR